MQNKHTKKEVAARWGVHELDIRSIMEKYPEDFNQIEIHPESGYIFTEAQMERFGCFIKNDTGVSWRTKILKLFGSACLALMFLACGRPYSEAEEFWRDHINSEYGGKLVNVQIKKYPESMITSEIANINKRILIAGIEFEIDGIQKQLVLGYYNDQWYALNGRAKEFLHFKYSPMVKFNIQEYPIKFGDYAKLSKWIFNDFDELTKAEILEVKEPRIKFHPNGEWGNVETLTDDDGYLGIYFEGAKTWDWNFQGYYKFENKFHFIHKETGKKLIVVSNQMLSESMVKFKGGILGITDQQVEELRQ